MADAKKGSQNARRLTAALRALNVDELQKKLSEEREKLMQDRFKQATATLENTSLLKSTRRQIARMETVLNEKLRGGTK